jgi:hypothetical protein
MLFRFVISIDVSVDLTTVIKYVAKVDNIIKNILLNEHTILRKHYYVKTLFNVCIFIIFEE